MNTSKPIRTRDNLPRGTVIPRGKRGGLVLPTLAQFKRLSLRRRTETFLAWVKTQKGSYTSTLPRQCALWQFGEALGLSDHYANCWSIFDHSKRTPFNEGEIQVISDTASIKALPVIHAPQIGGFSTFSSLVKRLEHHLATT